MQCEQELLWTKKTYKKILEFGRSYSRIINNIVLPVDNIPQASANSNVAGITSDKWKSLINAKKACQEWASPADNS